MSIKLKVTGNEITTNVHYLLAGLDNPNQHPIEAIIGLHDELDSKYIKPSTGIPASDLAEKYVSQNVLDSNIYSLQALYASCKIAINENKENIANNLSYIKINEENITEIGVALDKINDRLNKVPDKDTIFNGSSSIHQEEFTATEENKTFTISILDTDLKVIRPTIIKDNKLYSGNYSVSYPDDTTLQITFEENGTYLINYISGPVSESEYEVLLNYLKILEDKMLKYSSGSIVKPAHNVEYIYDDSGNLLEEIYTGNVNKVIKYEYNPNNNISKKTVIQEDNIKSAVYSYDDDDNLICIEDNGTDIPLDGTRAKSYTLNITYDENNNILKEEYRGDINKVIEYEYNNYSDVITKSVTEDGITKTAQYIYDQNRKLVNIVDSGTEAVTIVFPDSSSGGGTGGECQCPGTCCDEITKEDVDLIFNTIFEELIKE